MCCVMATDGLLERCLQDIHLDKEGKVQKLNAPEAGCSWNAASRCRKFNEK